MSQNALNTIPTSIFYIKNLRSLAGSIIATLLWQQLDLSFSKNPKGFHKFLNPPQTFYKEYVSGSSWTEQLGISEKEFRTAFDKIGVRHTSKGAFDKVANPFVKNSKELYFCSYHDKIKGITHYFRNHTFTNKALNSLDLQGGES